MNKKIQDVVCGGRDRLWHERKRKKHFISVCCSACDSWDGCSLGNSIAFWIKTLAAVKGRGKLM